MSREKTVEEIREEFLTHVNELINYWDNVDTETTKGKLEGLAFSILTVLDGCAMDLPAFILAPLTHKDDKQYAIDNGENYYPETHKLNVKSDIAGSLHDMLSKYK